MSSKILALVLMSFLMAGTTFCQNKTGTPAHSETKKYEITRTESEWKEILTEQEYEVLRNKGTEYAFTGKYNDFKQKGIFVCAGCGNTLFDSGSKYDSGSGWPSFYQPINQKAIVLEKDNSLGVMREEILCARCGGHLGHVFPDGPKPTGLRYCVNSISMDFVER
ncbi:MAG: peptide-methionine (R)-S-oxide reductase MsrB [Cyclobacteriaceae bacterium]|nr:peptide-methionine (R)-S-oxide reductase MsrB [Cyclobacteriaceae bacterium]